jgi:hypothetical protein
LLDLLNEYAPKTSYLRGTKMFIRAKVNGQLHVKQVTEIYKNKCMQMKQTNCFKNTIYSLSVASGDKLILFREKS